MWNNITSEVFSSPRQPALRAPVENAGKPAKVPWRTVGLTEQRLRAANKQSWVTSTKGWSDLLNRFSGR